MKNEKKSRRTCHLSSDLKDIIKYILIFGTILVFGVYLLADAEVLGNVKQQERPETSVMIGSGEKFETSFFCKTNRLSGVELFIYGKCVCHRKLSCNTLSGRKRNSGLGNKSADNICRRYYVFSTGSENPKL